MRATTFICCAVKSAMSFRFIREAASVASGEASPAAAGDAATPLSSPAKKSRHRGSTDCGSVRYER